MEDGTSKEREIKFCEKASYGFQSVVDFEDAFAAWIPAKNVVAVNSGYTALYLALYGLGVGVGDEVICPDFTMVATAHAISACGATPVFVDVQENGTIDVALAEKAITERTKAIIAVDIYGHPADWIRLERVAKRHGLKLVEDAAESHGAEVNGRPCGTFGDAACFSFYANKIINAGEGGAVVTADANLAERIKKLRSYSFGKDYMHDGWGWSFRMNPYGAEIGRQSVMMARLAILERQRLAANYTFQLRGLVKVPATKPGYTNVYWMYGVRTKEKKKVRDYLLKNGVQTREFFAPMHLQPMYKNIPMSTLADFPVASMLHEEGILLPSMRYVTESDQDRICKLIAEALSA